MRKYGIFVFFLSLLPVSVFLIGWTWLHPSRGDTRGILSETVDLDQPVGDFALTDQDGRLVTTQDLRGKVCVFDFIFTRCGGTCPQLTANMARLQKALAGKNDVRFVSVSVNPTFDTPEILKKYAERFGADKRWLFLTGAEEKIRTLCRTSFMSAMEKKPDAAPSDLVTHTSKVFVVDRNGIIRAMFDGRQFEDDLTPIDQVPQIQKKVEELLR
ncbi:MAG TPA: SCO family protein [Gemmataceae bacterium]|nr:SCO family protein [Gemmataceae bacterium]